MSEFGNKGKLPCDTLMEDYQYAAVAQWQFDNGGVLKRPAADAGKLLEEVMELCFASGMLPVEMDAIYMRELNKALQRGEAAGNFDRDKVESEFGDVIVSVAANAQRLSVDTIEATEKCLARIKDRKWAPNIDGVLVRPERHTDADKAALGKPAGDVSP